MATEILKRPFRFNFCQIGYFTDQDGTSLSGNNYVLGEGVSYRDMPKSSPVPMTQVNLTAEINASVLMGYQGAFGVSFYEPWEGDPAALTKHGNAYAQLKIIEASNDHKYWTGQTRTFDVWKTKHVAAGGGTYTRTKSTIQYTFQDTDFQTTTDDDGFFYLNPNGPSSYTKKRGILLGQWELVTNENHNLISSINWNVAGYIDDEENPYNDLTPETAEQPFGFFQPPGG